MLCLSSSPLHPHPPISISLTHYKREKMDTTPNHVSLYDEEEEEEYIDMELRSSPPQITEFEFQMSGSTTEPATTSSADELFYKGKLLPLHLPPRRLMLQTLLSTTPSSPSESRRVSCELNPPDYFFEWSGELDASVNNHPAKLTRLRKSILHASRTFLRSFFSTSRSSEKKAFGHIEERRRRSFSGAIKRHSPAKCLSSSSSNSTSSSSSSLSLHSNELLYLRRSSSAKEIEGSIQAAIAHCKKSCTKTCSLIGDVH